MNNRPYLGPAVSCFLDYARALAAMLVVLLHARLHVFGDMSMIRAANSGTEIPVSALQAFTGFGHEAVMMFFVMSGYLIGGKILNEAEIRRGFWGRYYLDRMTRIWIVAIPAILLSVVFAYLSLSLFSASYNTRSSDCAPTVGTVLGNLLFLHKVVVPVVCSNGAYWSIANEVFYYFVFPLIFIALLASRPFLSKLICATLALALLAYATFEPFGEGSILLYFPAWLLGAALAQTGLGALKNKVMWGLTLGGAVLALAFYPSKVLIADYLVVYAFAAAIWFARDGLPVRVRPASWVISIGKRAAAFSYSLYLFHLPVMNLLRAVFTHALEMPLARGELSVENFWIFVAFVLIAYVASYFAFLLFESRTTALRDAIAGRFFSRG